jgi:hypothetical protein
MVPRKLEGWQKVSLMVGWWRRVEVVVEGSEHRLQSHD